MLNTSQNEIRIGLTKSYKIEDLSIGVLNNDLNLNI